MEHKIQLENFYGPLDLLLHLIKENELEVTKIPIARVAEQYTAYIGMMQKLDIDIAGEFLVMASQLMLIKSRTLLPPLEEEETAEEEEDPSLDLIKKLLEYKKFKDRGRELLRLAELRALRHTRPSLRIATPEGEEKNEPPRDMELWDLVLFYSKVVKEVLLDVPMNILYFDTPIEVFMRRIEAALAKGEAVTFADLVGDGKNRAVLIGTFLALLEMVKEQKIVVDQPDGGEIRITAKPPSAPASPVPAETDPILPSSSPHPSM